MQSNINVVCIDKKTIVDEADIAQNMKLTSADLQLVLDIWMQEPMRYIGIALVMFGINAIMLVWSLTISSVYTFIVVALSFIKEALANNSSPAAGALLTLGFILVVLISIIPLTIVLLIPTPLLTFFDFGIRQGVIRTLQGDRLTFTDYFVPLREYWGRIAFVAVFFIVFEFLLGITIVGIPFIYAMELLLFSCFGFLLLTQPQMPIIRCVTLAVKANVTNIVPLLISVGIVVLLSLLNQLTSYVQIITYGFIILVQYVYAAKTFNMLRGPGNQEFQPEYALV
ncbi:hypothetical protein J8273_5429 [Carpediemonas membranifera]|uniref:Uncharacterized protein n=1 Tax=Carpediemonas membranifera TaxID=201153 RepID=A0A8J6DYL7_9EUKA|nr:hypothetical protein J8273_5429 [Carpediemonas membranifera]|eukprot:KAG9392439.1 hypothetical protein J8273_5429 [Carpediemonas membranifera]